MLTYGAGPALVASLFLAVAVTLGNGQYDRQALCLVLAAFLLGLGSVFGAVPWRVVTLVRLMWAGALLFSLDATTRSVGLYLRPEASHGLMLVLQLAWLTGILAYLPEVLERPVTPRLARLRGLSLGALAAGMGLWVLHASPAPRIDVWDVQQEGARVLLQGRNPYAQRAMQIDDTSPSEGLVIEAYVYPPLTLLTTTAAYAAAGDVRYLLLAAQLLAALSLALLARDQRVGELAALLLLSHPRGLFVLEQSWNEPLPLALLALFALAWLKQRKVLATVAVGTACATKQYLLLLLPFFGLLQGGGWALALAAGAVLLLTVLPFLAWSPIQFLQSTLVRAGGSVTYDSSAAFRTDALSLTSALGLPWLARVGFASPLLVWLAACRSRWPLARLLYLCAVVLLLFFLLARLAYCNYYYLIAGLLLLSAVTECAQPAWSEAPPAARRLSPLAAWLLSRWHTRPLASLLAITVLVKLGVLWYEWRAMNAGAAWCGHILVDVFGWLQFWRDVMSGLIPYVDMSREYPVGAGLVYAAMAPLLNLEPQWRQAFVVHGLVMLAAELASVALLYRCLHHHNPARARALTLLWIFTPTGLILGPVRFESWVVFFALLGYWRHLQGRPGAAALAWSIGSWLKWYPAFFLAAQEIRALVVERKRWQWLRSLVIFALVALALNGPFIVTSLNKLQNADHWLAPYRFHATRPLFWDTVLGVVTLYFGPVSWERQTAPLSALLMLALLLVRPRLPVEAKGALVCMAAVLFNRVYSTQFNLWFDPFLLILAARLPADRWLRALLGMYVLLDVLNVLVYPVTFTMCLRELGDFVPLRAREVGGAYTLLFAVVIALRTLVLAGLMALVWRRAPETRD